MYLLLKWELSSNFFGMGSLFKWIFRTEFDEFHAKNLMENFFPLKIPQEVAKYFFWSFWKFCWDFFFTSKYLPKKKSLSLECFPNFKTVLIESILIQSFFKKMLHQKQTFLPFPISTGSISENEKCGDWRKGSKTNKFFCDENSKTKRKEGEGKLCERFVGVIFRCREVKKIQSHQYWYVPHSGS